MDGIKLTGLWKNTGKNGKSYLSGKIGTARLLIFPNDFKRGEKDPDYQAFICPVDKKESRPADSADDSNYPSGEDIPF